MKKYFHASSQSHFVEGQSFTADEFQYPNNWFDHASPGEIAAAGFVLVQEIGARKDERFYVNYESLVGSNLNITSTIRAWPQVQNEFKDMIDQACGAKRARVISPGDYISEEYRRAYDDAMIYKAAGYIGTVPSSVASWKTASGMNNTAAADDIIATRDGYMALLDAVRAIRLSGKAAVDVAATPDAILAAVATVNASLAALP